MGNSFLAQLPYIVVAIIVFLLFIVISQIVTRIVHAAGERTRIDGTLADLLGRLASFVITDARHFRRGGHYFSGFQTPAI